MAREGWICPKCGRVYSTLIFECKECNDKIKAPPPTMPRHPDWRSGNSTNEE